MIALIKVNGRLWAGLGINFHEYIHEAKALWKAVNRKMVDVHTVCAINYIKVWSLSNVGYLTGTEL